MDTLEADVVAVAAGASDLAASIAAAEGGTKVIALGKVSTTGGTGNMKMGSLGLERRLQKLKQMRPTKNEASKIFMDYTHWRADAQLVRAHIDKVTTTIDWLEKMGVEFVEPETYSTGAHFRSLRIRHFQTMKGKGSHEKHHHILLSNGKY